MLVMTGSDSLSVGLAHHWLTTMRGGEKVLAVLAGLFPEAPVYTLLARRHRLSPELAARDIRTSRLQKLAWIPELHRRAMPLFPAAVRSLDAREHDVMICSDAANIKGIRTRPGALQICYCHSPVRYVWDLYDEYLAAAGPVSRIGLRLFADRLRRDDHAAAQTVTAFVANSRCVAERIRRCYGRGSVVIPPPVETNVPPAEDGPGEFYLVVSELVSYKRNDLAIAACNQLKAPLVVIGAGPLLDAMRRMAGPTVRILGWQPDEVVCDHMRRCRALLFCGLEDFGMVPVEVQAVGRPVIAYGRGGALETVLADRTGFFFERQDVASVMDAIRRFEANQSLWPAARIREHAQQFSVDAFRTRFTSFYKWALELWQSGGPERLRAAMESMEPEAQARGS
jgi:glycosyltransferase involved in cell wall biosynthesis